MGTLEIDRFVAGGGVEAAAEVDLSQGVQIAPALDHGVDVLVVDVEGFGLDERVLIAATGIGRMDMVDVEAAVDVFHVTVDVGPAQ